MSDFFCSDAAFARDEPMFATASRVDRWLLVEQYGPFSAETVPRGRIDANALEHLTALAAELRARLLLIRRPAAVAAEEGLRAFVADSRPGLERLQTTLVADELALCELTAGGPEWQPVAEPVYIVCTHGRHDPCCAVRGRPVAAALAEALAPGRVWESSHLGGDRFAGNVVALPYGLYLGRVEAEEASAVVEVVERGRVPVHYLRGRSCFSVPAQAAQHFARTVGGYGSFDAVDDLVPVQATRSPQDGEGAWTVRLACPAGDANVTVRRTLSAEEVRLTCHATEAKPYPRFELLRIAPIAAERPA